MMVTGSLEPKKGPIMLQKEAEFGGSQCLLDQGSWNEGWWNIDVDTSNP